MQNYNKKCRIKTHTVESRKMLNLTNTGNKIIIVNEIIHIWGVGKFGQ